MMEDSQPADTLIDPDKAKSSDGHSGGVGQS